MSISTIERYVLTTNQLSVAELRARFSCAVRNDPKFADAHAVWAHLERCLVGEIRSRQLKRVQFSKFELVAVNVNILILIVAIFVAVCSNGWNGVTISFMIVGIIVIAGLAIPVFFPHVAKIIRAIFGVIIASLYALLASALVTAVYADEPVVEIQDLLSISIFVFGVTSGVWIIGWAQESAWDRRQEQMARLRRNLVTLVSAEPEKLAASESPRLKKKRGRLFRFFSR